MKEKTIKFLDLYKEGEFNLVPDKNGVNFWLISSKIPNNRIQLVDKLVVKCDIPKDFIHNHVRNARIYLEEYVEDGEIVCYLKTRHQY